MPDHLKYMPAISRLTEIISFMSKRPISARGGISGARNKVPWHELGSKPNNKAAYFHKFAIYEMVPAKQNWTSIPPHTAICREYKDILPKRRGPISMARQVPEGGAPSLRRASPMR
jgi:hypothetical protein